MRQHSLSLTNLSAAPAVRPAEVHQRTEWGRKAILCGFIMALAGIVTYCYGSLQEGPDADIFSSLFQNGYLGWLSFLLLLTGVGIWTVGNVALLEEADHVSTDR